jgi:hypothetical protein
VWNSYTPAVKSGDSCADIDWKSLLITIAIAFIVIILLIAFGPSIIVWIVKILWWIISFPFKVIGKLIEDSKKRRKKKAEKMELEQPKKGKKIKSKKKKENKDTSGNMPQRMPKSHGGKARQKAQRNSEKSMR